MPCVRFRFFLAEMNTTKSNALQFKNDCVKIIAQYRGKVNTYKKNSRFLPSAVSEVAYIIPMRASSSRTDELALFIYVLIVFFFLINTIMPKIRVNITTEADSTSNSIELNMLKKSVGAALDSLQIFTNKQEFFTFFRVSANVSHLPMSGVG